MDARSLEVGATLGAGFPRHRHADLAVADGRGTGPLPAAALGGELLLVAPWPGIFDDLLPDVDHEAAAVAWVDGEVEEGAVGLSGWLSRVDAPGRDLLDRFARRHPAGDLLGIGRDRALLRLHVTGLVVTGPDARTLGPGAASALFRS